VKVISWISLLLECKNFTIAISGNRCLVRVAVEFYSQDTEPIMIFYRVAMCTFSLASSFAAILLLPGSVIGNEIIHLHSGNYYVQWLTNSLVQGQ